MTSLRTPRGEPRHDQPRHDQPRLRPSEERLVNAARSNRRIALAALVTAALALALGIWGFFAPGAASACQDTAWEVTPSIEDLPFGWSISASQYDVGRQQQTLVGPVPEDEFTGQAVVYATITCFPEGAEEAVRRSADAASAAGQTVTGRDDLGEQAFTAVDASGAIFIQFRRGSVVVYLAASSDAIPAEAEGVASAFDIAMGGQGIETPVGTPDTGVASPTEDLSSLLPTEEPIESVSPAAPELVAALPATVGDLVLTIDSVIGTDLLGDDQTSRAIAAALRAAGKVPEDLRVAQATDDGGVLWILAVRVEGMSVEEVTALVKDTWLAASGAGVTEKPVQLAGRTFTLIDYGDEGAKNYLIAEGDMVRVIETADEALAEQAAAALP